VRRPRRFARIARAQSGRLDATGGS